MNSSIYIVKGYHEITPVPETAKEVCLNYRFAVVFDTYHQDFDYMYFQHVLFIKILVKIAKILDSDTILIELDDDTYYHSVEEFSKYLFATPEEDRQPPQRIYFRKNGELICLEETEFWVLCGGNLPYSDSYTASFHTMNDMPDSFAKACCNASECKGTTIKEIIQASVEPIKLSRWRKIWGRLF